MALARTLTSRSTPVHLAARRADRLAAVAGAFNGVSYTACDVMDFASIGATVAAAAPQGALSGLVYAVGSIVLKPLKKVTADDMVETFRLNAVGALIAVQEAASALKAGNGSVVLFSTVAASCGFPNHVVIAAAKGAVEALTRSLAADLAPHVRVNAVAPSLLKTPLAEALTSNETMAKSIAALHPLPRLGEAEDAAEAAAFLLSPQASWITGQVIAVDGGRSTVRSRG